MSAPPIKKPKTAARAGKKPASAQITAEAILSSFTGPAPRVRTSIFYQCAMLIVAAAMLLLPLIYLGLIGAVGYGVYLHAVENVDILSKGAGPRALWAKAVAYLAPLIGGPILILFMVKPIFARTIDESDPLTLDASQEPLLFAFVAKLCETMGAPVPRRIDVDSLVNASAGYRRGLLSLFSSDMVLTIGLPLAAGMSLPQFVGVLAHEFGHFSQGSAMRLSYIVDRVNIWFAKVVYHRDEWDEWLIETGDSESALVSISVLLTRLAVWISRRILWILMLIGGLISSAMSRQMEYDADRRAASVTGSKVMAEALRRLSLLDVAFAMSMRDLQLSWEQRKLVDNLPVLVAATAARHSQKTVAEIIEDRAKERAGLFSTHPAFRRRQANLAKRNDVGVFAADGPATALFSNFKMIANAVSLTFYRRHIGLKVENSNLIPVEQVVKDTDRVREEQAALPGYFQDCLDEYEPLFLSVAAITPPANAKATLAKLKAARRQFEQAAPRYRKLILQIDELRVAVAAATSARLLIRAGFKINPREFKIERSTQEDAERVVRQAEIAIRHASAKLAPLYELLRIRLLSALQLARVPAIQQRLKPEMRDHVEIDRVVAALASLERASPIIARMMPTQLALKNLFACDEGEEMHELYPLLPAVEKSTAERIYGTMQDIRSVLSDGAYPFDHANGEVTICSYVTPKPPNPGNPHSIEVTSAHMIDRSAILYSSCMARLVRLAEAVERIAGLPPLKPPPPPELEQNTPATPK